MRPLENSLQGKRLLLLGGGSQMVNITKLAQKMGCMVFVVDYYDTTRSPAKLVADAYSDISIFDTEAVTNYIKQNGIDGVLCAFSDSYLFQYKKICESAGLPYYGSETAFGVATDKMLFKQACIKSGVGYIPGTNAYDFDTVVDFANKNGFPLMIKPTDNSGSRGVIKCECEAELKNCFDFAMSYSKSKNIIVEKFMEYPSVVCSYQLIDEDIRLSAFCDRFIYATKNGSAYTCESRYPSDYLNRFLLEEDENMRRLFKEHGFKHGTVAVMGYAHENGFYWCEMTYRPSGGHHYTVIEDQTGINGLALLIEFAVTGEVKNYDPTCENPHFKDCCGMVNISGIPERKVAKIEGLDEICKLENVLEVVQTTSVGQFTGKEGTTAQKLLSVWIKAPCWEEFDLFKEKIKSIYKVYDCDGNNIVI